MFHSDSITVSTRGRGAHDITHEVGRIVGDAGFAVGLANVFLHHTSASLVLCENADPSVRTDLEAWFSRLVKDGDPLFSHRAEGDDDMAGHVRTILTSSSLSVPVRAGGLALGTWQGLYLYEHRYRAHRRQVTVTVIGGK